MNCALCKNPRALRNSHIIPEFVYKPLYDSNHRFHVLSTLQRRSRPVEQKGLREKLLRGCCEQQFSGYEKYAREVLFGGEEITVAHKGKLLEIGLIDYKRFKLFQMSILWRASVSRHPFFSRVNLGPHEERVRNFLRSGDPSTPEKYSCMVIALRSDNGVVTDIIDSPERLRINGHNIYRFVFGAFMWLYFISAHNLPPFLKSVVLSTNGTMKVWIGKLEDIGYLRDFAVGLRKKDRLPSPTEMA
jgi:hypothetical protein